MNQDLYDQAIEYEKFTQEVYQSILAQKNVANVEVKHNKNIAGRSGVKHQVDVHWVCKQAGKDHTVLIECKNYNSSLTLEKVRNFFAVLHDIGNCTGVMVTPEGYQSGVVKFAEYYKISLKLLLEPTEEDWEGRIKDIKWRTIIRLPVSTKEKPLQADFILEPEMGLQKDKIDKLNSEGLLDIPDVPSTKLCDRNGHAVTEELGMLIPRKLDVLSRTQGGPYTEIISFKDDEYYVRVNPETENEDIVRILGIQAEYYVEEIISEKITRGGKLVKAVLKDFTSGEIDSFHMNKL